MSRLLQIVPRRPPPTESLFQVAERLSEEFLRRGDLRVETAVAADGLPEMLERTRNLEAGDAILVHYVGYGYARRGAPLRFSRALVRWKNAIRSRILLVHFHELAAFGPPWRSSFWLRPLQLRAARRLYRAADRSMTSLDRFASVLCQGGARDPIQVLPIFSTVGEVPEAAPLRERLLQLVLFGSPAARARIWSEARAELELALRALEVRSLVEIGREPVGPEEILGIRVVRSGELTDEETSQLLSKSTAAYFDYPVEYLSKSSAFAAASAHAVLPVCRPRRQHSAPADGEGVRWVAAAELQALDAEARQRVASAARQWYTGHSIIRHAEFWTGLLTR